MNRKLICALLCLSLSLGLCACGRSAAPEATPTSTEAASQPETPPPAETPVSVETPVPTDEPTQRQSVLPGAGLHAAQSDGQEDARTALIADAQRFVDGPLEALLEALGEPLSRDYAPSCLGSGQDGELRYEGFTVYTYRSDAGETVIGVE